MFQHSKSSLLTLSKVFDYRNVNMLSPSKSKTLLSTILVKLQLYDAKMFRINTYVYIYV